MYYIRLEESKTYLNTTKDLVMSFKAPTGVANLAFDMCATAASLDAAFHGYSNASF